MYFRITVAQANLTGSTKAPAEIDRVPRQYWLESRSVYNELPTDTVTKPIDEGLPNTPIDPSPLENAPEVEAEVVHILLQRLYAAKGPLLLVDRCVARHRQPHVMENMVRKSGLPTFVSPTGKSMVNETPINSVAYMQAIGLKRNCDNSLRLVSLCSVPSLVLTRLGSLKTCPLLILLIRLHYFARAFHEQVTLSCYWITKTIVADG